MDVVVPFIINKVGHTVLDIALENQAGLGVVGEFIGTDFTVGELIHFVAFETIVAVGGSGLHGIIRTILGNFGIEFNIAFLVVVGDGGVGQIDDEALVELTDGEVGGVRTVDDLEAVVEQSLALIVGDAEELHRGPGAAGSGTGPRHTEGDVVNSTRFQGEGTCGLHETTVVRLVAHLLFSPVLVTSVIAIVGGHTTSTPVARVSIAREHEVAGRTHGTFDARIGVAAVLHLVTIAPVTTEEEVSLLSVSRVAGGVGSVVVIEETAHTETFVIDDFVSEVHTVDGLVAKLRGAEGIVGDADGIARGGVDNGAHADCEVILGVVEVIGIHVGALEEVNTDRRGLVAVGFRFTATVDGVTVVTEAETAGDVATDEVVPAIAEVDIGPGAEVSAFEFVSGAVDNLVGAERHVVDFVVGGEAEGLAADFEADGLAGGLGVGVTFVVEHPPEGLVTFQHLVGEDGAVDRATVFFLHGRDLGVAEVVGDVVVGVVARFRVILAVSVLIEEGSHIVADA